MSRNIGRTNCRECSGPIECEEAPRPVTKEEAGVYFGSYSWLYVSKAHCAYCRTLYLAWHNKANDEPSAMLCDLSYRHAFNDESSEKDIDIDRIAWVQEQRYAAEVSLDLLLRKGPEPEPQAEVKLSQRVQLSQLVQQAVNAKLEEIGGHFQVNHVSTAHIRISVLEIVLDELSEQLFKLAGNGLPIQGQRRIARALGIPAPEAPVETGPLGATGYTGPSTPKTMRDHQHELNAAAEAYRKLRNAGVGDIIRETFLTGHMDVRLERKLNENTWEGVIVALKGRIKASIGESARITFHPDAKLKLV